MRLRTVRYTGANEEDQRVLLHDAVHPKKLLVCKDRNWKDQKRIAPHEFGELSKYEYVGLQNRIYAPVMTIDVDEPFDIMRVSKLGAQPNWIGVNTVSGHYQLIFYLDEPVFGRGNERQRYNAIQRGINRAIDGDNHFARNLARSPFSDSGQYEWSIVHHLTHTLDELHAVGLEGGVRNVEQVIEKASKRIDLEGKAFPELRKRALSLSLATLAEPTYDAEGLQRDTFLFRAGQLEAIRFGPTVEQSHMFTYLSAINEQIGLVDSRGPKPDSLVIDKARSITDWANNRMVVGVRGNGSGLSPWSAEQRVRGGEVQGRFNVLNGHWARVSEIGREHSQVSRSATSIIRAAEIQLAYGDGSTISQRKLSAQLGCSLSTVQRALTSI